MNKCMQSPVAMSVLWRECPQWTLWAPYGDPLQSTACASIEIQIICTLFWALEVICHCILAAAHYCFLIKKSGYTVEYWIFKTAQKGYLWRGLYVLSVSFDTWLTDIQKGTLQHLPVWWSTRGKKVLKCDTLRITDKSHICKETKVHYLIKEQQIKSASGYWNLGKVVIGSNNEKNRF